MALSSPSTPNGNGNGYGDVDDYEIFLSPRKAIEPSPESYSPLPPPSDVFDEPYAEVAPVVSTTVQEEIESTTTTKALASSNGSPSPLKRKSTTETEQRVASPLLVKKASSAAWRAALDSDSDGEAKAKRRARKNKRKSQQDAQPQTEPTTSTITQDNNDQTAMNLSESTNGSPTATTTRVTSTTTMVSDKEGYIAVSSATTIATSNGSSNGNENNEDSPKRMRVATTESNTSTPPSSLSLLSSTTTTSAVVSVTSPTQPLSPETASSSHILSQLSLLTGCRHVDIFKRLQKLGEGAYGNIYKAVDRDSGEIVAIKKMKVMKGKELEEYGFPIASLREIFFLLSLRHPNIVQAKEVVVSDKLDNVFIVMEYVDNDMRAILESRRENFAIGEVKCLMKQLLSAMAYLHECGIMHRDIKTSNLLLSKQGILKLADFGISRESSLHSKMKRLTPEVVTRFYRAPELLLGGVSYTKAIDMWSIGCVFAEFLTREILLTGHTELDQLDKMFKLLGTPSEKIWPGFSKLPNVKGIRFASQPYNLLRARFPQVTDQCRDLMNRMLTYDPAKRITAEEALLHPWFSEQPPPQDPELMPKFTR